MVPIPMGKLFWEWNFFPVGDRLWSRRNFWWGPKFWGQNFFYIDWAVIEWFNDWFIDHWLINDCLIWICFIIDWLLITYWLVIVYLLIDCYNIHTYIHNVQVLTPISYIYLSKDILQLHSISMAIIKTLHNSHHVNAVAGDLINLKKKV